MVFVQDVHRLNCLLRKYFTKKFGAYLKLHALNNIKKRQINYNSISFKNVNGKFYMFTITILSRI